MKNVLSIVPYRFLPAQSGGQKGIFLFYKYLKEEAAIICVSTRNNDLSSAAGISVLPLFSNSSLRYINFFYFFRLKKIIQKGNIDTIIIEHPYMGILGILLKSFCRKKLIVHNHNIEAIRFKELGKWWWRLLFFYEKRVLRSASFSFFITEEDRQFALQKFHLEKARTTVITYGTEVAGSCSVAEKKSAVAHLKSQYHIPEENTLLLFNGVFGYKPNDEALYLLVKKIMPLLLSKDRQFTLLLCGKNIPEEITKYASENICIKGFVEDINAVFKGAEIFLNPIWLGGGIKTKLVEALSYGASAVSFQSGAIGIDKNTVGNKLQIAEDENVPAFVEKILAEKKNTENPTPDSFYHHFYWANIAQKAGEYL